MGLRSKYVVVGLLALLAFSSVLAAQEPAKSKPGSGKRMKRPEGRRLFTISAELG